MGLTLVTPPTVWPVTLDEAKLQCGIRSSDWDSRIQGLIEAATDDVEGGLSISVAEQQWKLTLDAFADNIELLRGPVISVDEITYVDDDGEAQTADDADYTLDLTGKRQWIVRNSGASWPGTLNGINAVAVTYTAGMDPVPASLKHAVLIRIQHLFERQADPKVAEAQERAFDSLLQKFRTVMV